MTDEHKKNETGTAAGVNRDDTSWATVARDALASTAELIAIPPDRIAKLLLYEARDAEVSPFTLLVQVKAHAVWWANLLDALKAGAIATGGG